MATANSIGSNVFDILIGLALPWFFQTALLHPGSRVNVSLYTWFIIKGSCSIRYYHSCQRSCL